MARYGRHSSGRRDFRGGWVGVGQQAKFSRMIII